MVGIFTAQYRYTGPDRLDITVKGKDPVGRIFAPTWEMVMKAKKGLISEDEYTVMYRDLMRASFRGHRKAWEEILGRDRVTFVCFCPPGSFCHRYLLARYFECLGAAYLGEQQ